MGGDGRERRELIACKGVVDASLMVHGTDNLRVVDASIIPLHISANPQASIYAIAEKVGKIVLFVLIVCSCLLKGRRYHQSPQCMKTADA